MADISLEVLHNGKLVGILKRISGKGYFFSYSTEYLEDLTAPQISLSFPKQREPFFSKVLFPFFYGLLAEGSNKEIQTRLLKIDEKDTFRRLAETAVSDTIGGITVRKI